MRYRPKHIAEYAMLRGAVAVLGYLPYRLALGVGWVVALTLWCVLWRRLSEARRRMRSVLGHGGWLEADRRGVPWLAWRNLVFSVVDVLRLSHLSAAWVRRAVDYRSVEVLQARLRESGRVILAVPHMGSWEMAGVAMFFFGLRMFYIVKRQKNPLTDAYLNRLRASKGFECLDRDSKTLLRTVARRIKEGKVLAILPDVRARDGSLQVRFLGGNASVMKGMALFAKMTDAPILPAYVVREGWTRHRWRVFAPVCPDPALDRDADVQRMTQRVFDIFDQAVREHPDQYFWFNKRWILEPFAPAAAVPEPAGTPPEVPS